MKTLRLAGEYNLIFSFIHCLGPEPGAPRKNVTSPGGTTEAALQVLMDRKKGLPVLVEKALRSAIKRAKKLKG